MIRFSMDIANSIISPLVIGQVDVMHYQTALAEVRTDHYWLSVHRLFSSHSVTSRVFVAQTLITWCLEYILYNLIPQVTVSGTSGMKYGATVQAPVEIDSAPNFSLENLVPIPCGGFVERGFVADLNTAITTAIMSTTVFNEGKRKY